MPITKCETYASHVRVATKCDAYVPHCARTVFLACCAGNVPRTIVIWEPNPGSELLHHVRFSSNPNLKVRKTRFFLYLSIDNFANFYYFLNMRKLSNRATFMLSISLFTCTIIIFLTSDIAD